MVRHLFELEVPEIEAGTVEIVNIAREAGVRSKVAVVSHAAGVDPVGTFVGGRGSRVQAVMGELGEEKIDIIPFAEDPKTYIANALSPTKVVDVLLYEEDRKAVVRVPEDQLSLAIGKQGQNVRLAAKLTGWNIDILSADESHIEAAEAAAAPADVVEDVKRDLEDDLIDAVTKGAEIDPAMDEEATETQVDALSGQVEIDESEAK
jgi:N utilization substance protein A